jgi:hypothetical protein
VAIVDGPVLFVDDEWRKSSSAANQLYLEIVASGRPIAAFDEIPQEEAHDLWGGLGFVVVDWNLNEPDSRLAGGAELSKFAREQMVQFLKKLIKDHFCPIFIVSSSASADILRHLNADRALSEKVVQNRITILHKGTVLQHLMDKIAKSLAGNSSVEVLRVWEREYQRAKSQLFNDFFELSDEWPRYVVKAANKDKFDPSYELADVIHANLRSRVNPMLFDTTKLATTTFHVDPSATRNVLRGRMQVPRAGLHDEVIMPGDFFKSWLKDEADVIWINLTPACQTVRGRRKAGEPDVRLHLVRGEPHQVPSTRDGFEDEMKELRANPNVALVDVLADERAYKFDFRTLQTFSWSTIGRHRLGRLLPPYSTHLQQRHAAFLLNEGIPRVPHDLYKGIT